MLSSDKAPAIPTSCVQWLQVVTVRAVAIDWTNYFLGAAAAWLHFECNAKPLVDNAGLGNGSAAFNPAVTNEVAPIWVQWRVTLTNNYV
jgi:hypothetical protein